MAFAVDIGTTRNSIGRTHSDDFAKLRKYALSKIHKNTTRDAHCAIAPGPDNLTNTMRWHEPLTSIWIGAKMARAMLADTYSSDSNKDARQMESCNRKFVNSCLQICIVIYSRAKYCFFYSQHRTAYQRSQVFKSLSMQVHAIHSF